MSNVNYLDVENVSVHIKIVYHANQRISVYNIDDSYCQSALTKTFFFKFQSFTYRNFVCIINQHLHGFLENKSNNKY